MVGHEIEDDLKPACVRGVDERVEIGHGAEQRIDAGIVGDIIAEIGHRRGEDRRQPDRVDAEVQQIGQPVDNALDVADPVGIGVLKRAGIDLIEHAVPPPTSVILLPRSVRGDNLNHEVSTSPSIPLLRSRLLASSTAAALPPTT